MRSIVIVVVALCLSLQVSEAHKLAPNTFDNLTIETEYGPVTGFLETISTFQARAFYGIPYAAPPVGNLRWSDPQPPAQWNTPLMANHFGPGCPQFCNLPNYTCPTSFDEDCLYLNVWAPVTISEPAPVMFWIHGGHYEQGSGAGPLYEGVVLASKGAVIVTINYRLAALGFLWFDSAPGNFGMKDQLFALQWVQKNIAAFGGDPNRVTLFGQSAGGTSVSVLLTAPSVVNAVPPLYHSAIVHSNPIGLPMMTPEAGKELTLRLQALVNCSSTETDIACMRNVGMLPLIVAQAEAAAHVDIKHILDVFYPWAPALGDFLPDEPLTLFQNGKGAVVPTVWGTVEEEGRIFVYEAVTSALNTLEYDAFIAVSFGITHLGTIASAYPSQSGDNRDIACAMITDRLFTCPQRAAMRGQAKLNTTFQYRFNHSFDNSGIWQMLSMCEGHVCHAIELPFVFNDLHANVIPVSPREVDLADRISTAWANFAITNNPQVANWAPFDANNDNTYVWDVDNQSGAITGLRGSFCDMWDKVGYQF